MITVLTWNIQNGQGVDGNISLKRIAESILNMCDPDVICLQEVSVNCRLSDGTQPDQVTELSILFSDYSVFFGPAYDIKRENSEVREQYGNLILSKFPVLSSFNHILPQTVNSSFRQMPRQLSEITIKTPLFPLCIMTTHLEFHSEFQRCEQVRRIVSINQEINNLAMMPPLFDNNGSYRKFERSDRVILCGDFNFNPGSVEYNLLTSNEINSNFFLDAWKQLNPNSTHAPTCGIFDKKQWPEGPHCRDFGFISRNLEGSLDSIEVNEKIDASDHQPVVFTFS